MQLIQCYGVAAFIPNQISIPEVLEGELFLDGASTHKIQPQYYNCGFMVRIEQWLNVGCF